MSEGRDSSFGRTAVKLGFVAEAQVTECLDIQQKMAAMGVDETIGEILQKKGYLTGQQHRAILKAMGVSVSPIPGYKLVARIGQGGMGSVYKALQTSMNRTVAIKILSDQFTKDPSYVARFFQEAQAAAKLNHKNVMAAYDAGEAHGTCYFVMEFVDGRTTRELHTGAGNFSEAMTMDVANQMAEALEYLHRHKVIHRDIKPENIMISTDGTAKLCDFGLAKSRDVEQQSLTQSGYVVGTPYYMSPEQVRGDKDLDIRADLYSLGATLYFLATGRWVFEGKTAAETMSLHLTAPVPDPRKIAPQMSEGLASILVKLLEKDRSERYQIPHELLEDLAKLRQGAAPVHAKRHPTHAHLKRSHHHVPKKSSPIGLIVGGGLAAAVLVAIIFAASNGSTPPPASPPAASKPPVEKPRDPETSAPAVNTAREADAGRLNALALEHANAGRWKDAKAALEQLKTTLADTDFVRKNAAAIGERLGACEAKLQAATAALTGRYAEARRLIGAERWEDARAVLDAMRTEGRFSAEVTVEMIDLNLATCAAELKAEDAMAAIVANVNAERWDLVVDGTAAFRRDHGRTVTGRKEASAVEGFERTARREKEAQTAIATADQLAGRGEWADCAATMTKIAQEFAATKAYAKNRPVLDRIGAQIVESRRREMETEAEISWKDTQRKVDDLVRSLKFDDADALISGWELQYRQTEAYKKSLGGEAERLHKSVAKSRDKAREETASALVKQAKEDWQARRWEPLWKAVEALARDYAGSQAAKLNAPVLKRYREDCEREGGFGGHVVWRDEFEATPENWRMVSENDGSAAFSLVPEARDGALAGRFQFNRCSNARYCFLTQTVKLDPKVDVITFYARAARKGAVLLLRPMLAEFVSGVDEEFVVDVRNITDQWTRVSLKVADFKLTYSTGDGNKTLDRDRINSFGFMQTDRAIELEFFVDNLRFEAARK